MIQTGSIQDVPIGARIIQVFNPVKGCWTDVDIEGKNAIPINSDEFVFYVNAICTHKGFPGFLLRISINRNTAVKWEI